jgi:type I restriction enzyme S subunit
MSIDIKFVPLSFINSEEEILKQIKNTVVFSFLFKTHKETSLNHYLESTQYGYTASAAIGGTHKLLRITDINNGSVDWDTVPFCNCDSERKYLLKDNDILVARTGGTTGKSFVVKNAPDNAVFASYLIRLRIKEQVNIDFINSFLNSYAFWGQIIEMKSGTGIPNVNAEKLKTLILPDCDFQTQCDVVDYIRNNNNNERFNDLNLSIPHIESLYNDNNLLTTELVYQLLLVKKLRQQLLQDAIQGKLVPQDENDEPASKLLESIISEKVKDKKYKELPSIKAEEIPFKLPDSWVWCRLGSICSKIGSGSTPNGSNYSKDGIPFFRSQNIHDSGLVYDDIKFISSEVHNKMSGTITYANDILLNITGGSMGRCALVPNDFHEGNVSQHVCIIRPIIVDNQFYHKVILSPFFQALIFSSTTGAGREGLPKYNLEQFLIPLPPLAEQHRILVKLVELMQICDELEITIHQSKGQNEQLLQQVLREALKD